MSLLYIYGFFGGIILEKNLKKIGGACEFRGHFDLWTRVVTTLARLVGVVPCAFKSLGTTKHISRVALSLLKDVKVQEHRNLWGKHRSGAQI